jgi:hypothetical protein
MASVHTFLALALEGVIRLGWKGGVVLAIALPLSLYALGAFNQEDQFKVYGKV